MIESDQNDKERQDEIPSLNNSNNSIHTSEPKQKRLREETSENEKFDPPSKKLCSFVDETMSTNNNIGNTSEVNGISKEVKENAKDISGDNKEDKIKSLSEDNRNEIVTETDVATSKSRNDTLINNDVAVEGDTTPNISTDIKQKESISVESAINENVEGAIVKEEIGKEKKVEEKQVEEQEKEENDQGAGEEEEVSIKPKKKNRKSQIENAEVVEGLELSVECASDKESSSVSENEAEENKEPKPKTIIVKAKPNDSELDISSSEADKSDSQDASEVKPKQTTKRGKKKGRTSFSKTKNTDSEENNDDVSDEDYSPKTKKKLKKVMTSKKTTESKRGRGKTKREVKKLLEKEDEEDENSNITTEDVRTEENESDMESVKSKSKDESDNEDTSKDRKRNRNTRPEDDKRIQLYKKYIRIAGIYVKSYNDLWVDCKSHAARIRCLKALLEKNGVNGRPTVEKCKKAKERNESLKDVAELSTSNIISEGRVTRAQRNKDSNRESIKTSETPTKHREARNTFKRVLSVVDSDSE
ncbi:uncharacterized protein LOC143429235 [Xylocopa sonorina]|uniref:uncharacterized protein LOC143429235 n=1 Tax=Xylocopa sonorina TaxID=1818115 RepID=UPI00403B1988